MQVVVVVEQAPPPRVLILAVRVAEATEQHNHTLLQLQQPLVQQTLAVAVAVAQQQAVQVL
jgi:hypothetical protein